MVILADDNGVVIEALGDADFLERADRVALRAGASWHEDHRGTNAIGTALAESAPVVVHGGEHFFEQNRFLSCTAVPVVGPGGDVLGILDISAHHSGHHPHSVALVRTAGHMIENQLFEARHDGALRLHLHSRAEGLGTLAEGLVALSETGQIVGANRAGLALLGLDVGDIGRVRIEEALSLRLAAIQDHGRRRPGGMVSAVGADGRSLFVRIEPGRGAVPRPNRPAPFQPVRDALSELDTGDERMARAVDRARKVAGKPIPLLLQGESGVGKEMFAAAIHAAGPRRSQPIVAVNCSALPEHMIEAELFGYAPGAFTGARRDGSPGRIREAHGGTLFLDEIGDMPLTLQTRLLRVLQERQVVPLGGGKPTSVDFALIAASHRPLKTEVEAGRFRADLYYRLNGLTLVLPPLRERSDFLVLVARMLDTFAPNAGLTLAPDVADAFATYRWPGNLRELANVLRFACALLDPGEDAVGWDHLPEDFVEDLRCPSVAPVGGEIGTATLRAASDSLIERMLVASGGNLSEAARRLGISRNTLYRRINGRR
ncbi:sigma-54-dependent Fis family transcriptional regulator [Magnetospirillum molischianum]